MGFERGLVLNQVTGWMSDNVVACGGAASLACRGAAVCGNKRSVSCEQRGYDLTRSRWVREAGVDDWFSNVGAP